MADLKIHELAFGGRAFEPLTDAGLDWRNAAERGMGWHEANYFTNEDACMAGFPDGSLGVEPQDFDGLFDNATDAGLVMVNADGNQIVKS